MELWKALSTPRRREILRLVWDHELSVSDIRSTQSDISLGAVSQHLRVLQQAGLVSLRREGVQHFYAAKIGDLHQLKAYCLFGQFGFPEKSKKERTNRAIANARGTHAHVILVDIEEGVSI